MWRVIEKDYQPRSIILPVKNKRHPFRLADDIKSPLNACDVKTLLDLDFIRIGDNNDGHNDRNDKYKIIVIWTAWQQHKLPRIDHISCISRPFISDIFQIANIKKLAILLAQTHPRNKKDKPIMSRQWSQNSLHDALGNVT